MATDFGKRIRAARRHAGLSQAALAQAVGMSQPSMSEAENTAHSSQFTAQIARACGVDGHWLATGAGEMLDTKTAFLSLGYVENVEPLISQQYGVPLISWVQAGTWSDIADPYTLGEAEEWLPCPVKHGPRTYCLRVRGDSMHNPDARPSYANGDIIFVDPDKEAKPGDRVIVRMDDQNEATFKQLLIEDGRKLLKALNPSWTPRYTEINGNATITGVVIGKWVAE